MDKQQPNWQPLSMLPLFIELIDGTLESAIDQLDSLAPVIGMPHILDTNTVERIITLYTEQAEDHWFFEAQLIRWKNEGLPDKDIQEIDRLQGQLSKTKSIGEKILKIVQGIEHNTIDKIMDMDELELAESVLSGKIKPPL